jgi:hypothetical protein
MQFRSATAIVAASCAAATGQPSRLALAGEPRKATKIFSVIWSVATVPPAATGLPDIPLARSVAALRVERRQPVALAARSDRDSPSRSIFPGVLCSFGFVEPAAYDIRKQAARPDFPSVLTTSINTSWPRTPAAPNRAAERTHAPTTNRRFMHEAARSAEQVEQKHQLRDTPSVGITRRRLHYCV